mmetsp:Transcript_40847/g.93743  ORF Transcript_40847/g.93743 Transcript_40847/m.93743 type:complete len:208 (+) Transcript_40847:2263-2886(+)
MSCARMPMRSLMLSLTRRRIPTLSRPGGSVLSSSRWTSTSAVSSPWRFISPDSTWSMLVDSSCSAEPSRMQPFFAFSVISSRVVGFNNLSRSGSTVSSESGVRPRHEHSSSDGRVVWSLESPTIIEISSRRNLSLSHVSSVAPLSLRKLTPGGRGVPASAPTSPKVSRLPNRAKGTWLGREVAVCPWLKYTCSSPLRTRPKVCWLTF